MTRPWRIVVRASLLAALLWLPAAVHAETQKYALVIGITKYPEFDRKPRLLNSRLKYADRDAEEFAKFITSRAGGGFLESNVRLLVNDAATRTAIFQALRWLHDVVRPEDQVYVFFAGHGLPDLNGRAFFMPHDADPEYPEDRGIRADEFLQAVKDRISPKHLVFFIDACYAGAANVEGAITRRGAQDFDWKAELDAAPAVKMAFLSATSRQLSYEDDQFEHGVFTYFMLRGLRGAADAAQPGNGDGKVTAGELNAYVHAQVSTTMLERRKVRQTPTITSDYDADFPLAVVAPSPPRPQASATVEEALFAFKIAYEARRLDDILRVYPTVNPDEFERNFRPYSAISINPGEPQIRLNGAKATATATYRRYTMFVTVDGGQQETLVSRVEFELARNVLGWVISKYTFAPIK